MQKSNKVVFVYENVLFANDDGTIYPVEDDVISSTYFNTVEQYKSLFNYMKLLNYNSLEEQFCLEEYNNFFNLLKDLTKLVHKIEINNYGDDVYNVRMYLVVDYY